ncbi:MAG: adenylosuccinate synthase [Candidatus Coatesbacteria bacterium]|nr:MAG: adenylosuccinate synthase [Candidatus Coatesbacteria bacterium]
MGVTVMVGAQWGDEGKGKIADVLSAECDLMARCNGGNNAGHTIVIDGVQHILHLVPSGIFRPGVRCCVGRGVIVDPFVLLDEIDYVKSTGADVSTLLIDYACHLILPIHKTLDAAQEALMGKSALGTTKRGIGPCYADKQYRLGVRLEDLLFDYDFAAKMEMCYVRHAPVLEAAGVSADFSVDLDAVLGVADRLRQFAGDVGAEVRSYITEGKRVFVEGAQGLLLDPDHGTYPYVTSSTIHPAVAASGIGIPGTKVDEVLGVVKAYQTRVGAGPMPTELDGDVADMIRDRGGEYGATTGRPRRVGWLDLPLLRYAVETAGINSIALTKLDVLAGMDELFVCDAYEMASETVGTFGQPFGRIWDAKPVLKEMEPFEGGWDGISTYDELPAAARLYIEFVEDAVGASVRYVSTGPGRDEIVTKKP